MIHHGPALLSVIHLSWGVLLAAAVVAMVAASRRRRARCCGPTRAVYPPRRVVVPPVVVRPVLVRPVVPPMAVQSGGGVRRYVWGVVIVLIVMAAAVKTVAVRTQSDAPPAFVPADPADVAGVPPLPPEAQPAQVVVKAEGRRKPRDWWKSDKPAPPVVEPAALPREWTVERGTVLSQADSRDAVLETVRQFLETTLHLEQPPAAKFVGNSRWVRIEEQKREPIGQKAGGEDVYRITYRVELTPQGVAELAREERSGRVGERMDLAARGLGLLTVLLGAVAGYVRLDEWTKGYYSGRLLLVAAAVVLTAGAAIVHPML